MTDRNDALDAVFVAADGNTWVEAVAEEPNAAVPQLRQWWDGLPDRDEAWLPVAPMDGCTFSGYESSDKGAFRSVDRTVKGRNYKGQALRTRPDKDAYRYINLRCDSTDPNHERVHTFHAAAVMLTTFDRPRPAGMEVCHNRPGITGRSFNFSARGCRVGHQPANHQDQVDAGTAVTPGPSFPCRNGRRARTRTRSRTAAKGNAAGPAWCSLAWTPPRC